MAVFGFQRDVEYNSRRDSGKKKKVVFTVTCLGKNGSVGRDIFFQSKQMKCTYLLSLCSTSINFMFTKEKES